MAHWNYRAIHCAAIGQDWGPVYNYVFISKTSDKAHLDRVFEGKKQHYSLFFYVNKDLFYLMTKKGKKVKHEPHNIRFIVSVCIITKWFLCLIQSNILAFYALKIILFEWIVELNYIFILKYFSDFSDEDDDDNDLQSKSHVADPIIEPKVIDNLFIWRFFHQKIPVMNIYNI